MMKKAARWLNKNEIVLNFVLGLLAIANLTLILVFNKPKNVDWVEVTLCVIISLSSAAKIYLHFKNKPS